MTATGVRVDDRDGVRHLVFDRPEKKNALTSAMYATLADAVDSAAADGIGALLFASSSGVFTAGNDLRDFLERPPHGGEAPVFRFLTALVDTDIPVVAAVGGPAIGIGTTMLLHCDLVYASPAASLRVPFIDLGLVPEAASSLLLPERIGRARAGAALFLGEPIDAPAALAAGLVTAIVAADELETRAAFAARTVASKPRMAVRETKRLLRADRPAIHAALARERAAFEQRLDSDEARAAMGAFFTRAAG